MDKRDVYQVINWMVQNYEISLPDDDLQAYRMADGDDVGKMVEDFMEASKE